MKHSGLLTVGCDYAHLKQRRQLREDGCTILASERYIDDILSEIGMHTCSPAPTPITKGRAPEDIESGELGSEDKARFRRAVSIAKFLVHHLPVIRFAVKELGKQVNFPNQEDMKRLKRLARFLQGARHLGVHISSGDEIDGLDVFVDTDWGGDKVSRKGTTSIAIFVGGSLYSDFCRDQTVIAQSSGECEYYGLAAGCSEGLHVKSILEFFGFPSALRVHTDSTAARGISQRQGVGKVRHLEVKTLWVQQLVQQKRLEVLKVAGDQNPADLNTKVHGKAKFLELVKLYGVKNAGQKDDDFTVATITNETRGGFTGGGSEGGIWLPFTLLASLSAGVRGQRCETDTSTTSMFEEMLVGDVCPHCRVVTLMLGAVLFLIVGLVLGLFLGRKREKILADKKVQAQTTYRRNLTTPRFQVLGEEFLDVTD